jgi:hypothetical protein
MRRYQFKRPERYIQRCRGCGCRFDQLHLPTKHCRRRWVGHQLNLAVRRYREVSR